MTFSSDPVTFAGFLILKRIEGYLNISELQCASELYDWYSEGGEFITKFRSSAFGKTHYDTSNVLDAFYFPLKAKGY